MLSTWISISITSLARFQIPSTIWSPLQRCRFLNCLFTHRSFSWHLPDRQTPDWIGPHLDLQAPRFQCGPEPFQLSASLLLQAQHLWFVHQWSNITTAIAATATRIRWRSGLLSVQQCHYQQNQRTAVCGRQPLSAVLWIRPDRTPAGQQLCAVLGASAHARQPVRLLSVRLQCDQVVGDRSVCASSSLHPVGGFKGGDSGVGL